MSSQPAATPADAGASRITPTLLRSTFAASLGGLLFGFDTAVIAGTTGALTRLYHLSARDLGYTVASALVGTIVGAALAGAAGDRFGRRDSLRGLALLYLLSSLGCALAWNWPSLIAFRTIAGLGIGGSSVLGPMYIAEIAPARWRGRLVGMFQLNIVLGILLAYFSNYLIGLGSFGASEWRVKFGEPPSLHSSSWRCSLLFPAVRAGWWAADAPRRPCRSWKRSVNLGRRTR